MSEEAKELSFGHRHGLNSDQHSPEPPDPRPVDSAREPSGGVMDKLLLRRKKAPPDPEPMRRFEQNVTELLAAVKEITAKQQLEDIQYELARITNLIPNLRNCDHLDRVAHLKLAVAALGADKPN